MLQDGGSIVYIPVLLTTSHSGHMSGLCNSKDEVHGLGVLPVGDEASWSPSPGAGSAPGRSC